MLLDELSDLLKLGVGGAGDLDHVLVAARLKRAQLVVDIGCASAHSCGKVLAHLAQDDDFF